MNLLLPLLVCLASAPPPDSRPPPAALRRALEAHVRSAVEVEGPRGRGPGVVVGGGGEVLTTVDFVGLTRARLWHGEQVHEGEVLLADATSRLALVRPLPGAGQPPPAVAVRALERVERGTWLLAVERWRGRTYPVRLRAVGEAEAGSARFTLDRALPAGTPLYDGQGRLVALVVRRSGSRRSQAMPLAALQRRVSTHAEATP